MDCDDFAKATRMGRIAAARLHAALEGAPWDAFFARQIFKLIFSKAGRVESLQPVLAFLNDLRVPSLFELTRDQALDQVEEIVRKHQRGTLDLVVRTCVQRAVVSGGIPTGQAFIADFLGLLLERFIVDGKGGLRELRGDESLREMRPSIRRLLAPVIQEATAAFEARPAGTLRGLIDENRLTVTSDLLGNAAP